ncbi:MAG: 50S ribosomal protein L17 [Saprospiraceae bacterium]|nr:50S ribosomal protein L17 [Saprospiraceae bacterium]
MRHGKKFNHLKRKAGHRKALLRNMSIALIQHKRINTTLAKAKALRIYLEPLVTKTKSNTTHSRRVVFSYLQDKEAIKELFDEIGPNVASRPGGYLRIIKTGFRKSDGAEMAMIEFVDYNDVYSPNDDSSQGGGRRRRRRKKSSGAENTAAEATTATETAVEETNDEAATDSAQDEADAPEQKEEDKKDGE